MCTSHWENIPTAPPSFRQKIRSKVRAYGALLLNRKLSSCGTLSPPSLGCIRSWKAMSAKPYEYGCVRLWIPKDGLPINGLI